MYYWPIFDLPIFNSPICHIYILVNLNTNFNSEKPLNCPINTVADAYDANSRQWKQVLESLLFPEELNAISSVSLQSFWGRTNWSGISLLMEFTLSNQATTCLLDRRWKPLETNQNPLTNLLGICGKWFGSSRYLTKLKASFIFTLLFFRSINPHQLIDFSQ